MSKLTIASNNLGENNENNPIIKEFLKWVACKEEEVLHQTLMRFCLYRAAKVDIGRVDFRVFESQGKPNYCEYYYMGKVRGVDGSKHLLMSRDLKVIPGNEVPVLEILFGKDKHTELSKCFF
jgi:hypothetical protein